MSGSATDTYASPHDTSWNPRSRPIISCLNCRRKKQKCDRRLPCDTCLRSGRPGSCQYAPGQEPVSSDGAESPQLNKRRRIDTANGPDGTSSVSVVRFEELQDRVKHLERQVEAQSQQIRDLINTTNSDTGSVRVTRDSHRHSELVLLQPPRYQFPDLQTFIDGLGRNDQSDETIELASTLHNLSRSFEGSNLRETTFNVYSNVSNVLAHMANMLPAVDRCKPLIDVYFQAFEGPLRILHSNAKTQFEAFLHGHLAGTQWPVTTTLPTVIAVVSIVSTLGTCLECENPKLHGQDDGVGAYQLLRNYLALLTEEEWGQLPNLQIAALTLKQHRSSRLTPVQTWRWSGEVVRRAMAAGIHHPLLNSSTVFDTEMKMRLWLTILEMDLTFAIASDMPVTCPTWNNDTTANVDDDKLHTELEVIPQNDDIQEWTDGICQHVLAQSFNDRQAAYTLVASGGLAPYNTVLQHTRRLEQIIHDLPRVFRLTPTSDREADSPYRLIVKMEMDFLLRRPLNACYAAHGAQMPAHDEYKEARIPWVQSTSFSLCFQDLFDPKYPMLDLPLAAGLWDFYHNAYKWDVERFFLASCLELQRLRSSNNSAIDVASQPFHGHTLHGPVKIMGWTIDSMTISLEETIDPLIRRLGRHGSDFGQVVKWVAIIGALRVNPSSSRQQAIHNELQSFIAIVRGLRDQDNLSSHSDRTGPGMTPESQLTSILWLRAILSPDDVNSQDTRIF